MTRAGRPRLASVVRRRVLGYCGAVLALAFAAAAGSFADGMAQAAAKSTLTFFAVDYPPYDIERPEDGRRGFDVEVVEAAFALAGIEAHVGFLPWKRALVMAEAGEIPGVVSCADVPERRSFIAVSQPISVTTPTLVVAREYKGPSMQSLKDVKGLRAMGVVGYSYEEDLTKLQIPHIAMWSDSAALRALTDDRADVFYTVRENTTYLARSLGIADRLRYFDIVDQPKTEFHLCFSKKWPGYAALLDRFAAGLTALRESGRYDAIHARYR